MELINLVLTFSFARQVERNSQIGCAVKKSRLQLRGDRDWCCCYSSKQPGRLILALYVLYIMSTRNSERMKFPMTMRFYPTAEISQWRSRAV